MTPNPTRTAIRNRKLAAARAQVADLAVELQEQLRPVEVAKIFLGTGSGVLTMAHGSQAASLYLSELADCV